jgi:hypothetical protein
LTASDGRPSVDRMGIMTTPTHFAAVGSVGYARDERVIEQSAGDRCGHPALPVSATTLRR